MTDEEIEKAADEVIKYCQGNAMETFQGMQKMTAKPGMSVIGLEAYIYGFLAPIFAGMHVNQLPKEVQRKVREMVISMMDTLTEVTDERDKKRKH